MTRCWTLGRIIKRLLLVAALLIIVLNWTWGRIPKQPPVPYGKFANVGDLRIHYVEKPGADPPVVMIHGLPGTWNDWNAVTTRLPGRHTIAIDRPGFAYSDGDYVPFDEQITTIHQLVHQLKLKNPVIAGHSYGGTLALAYAKTYPGETKAIVPVDPAVTNEIGRFELVQARFVQLLQIPVIKQVADATFSQVTRTASADSGDKQAFDPDPVNEQHKKHLLELNMQSDDLKAYAGEMTHFDDVMQQHEAGFASIVTPTYFVQGREDKLVTASTVSALAKKIRGAHILLLPGGHMQTYVHPDQVAAQIKAASR